MKTIELQDALTGKALHVEFDLDQDTMKINGEPVERKRALESNENQFVYGPPGPGPSEIIHLDKAQVNEMRRLWGIDPLPSADNK